MPAPPPTRAALRQRYDRRQQQVIAAAARVFAAKGFHATTMQDLTEASGLTAGGLYHYIESKDQLLIQICDDLMEPLLARVREIVDSGAPFEVQLRQIVRAWVSHIERNHDHMLVFQQERHVLKVGPQWRHIRRQRKEFERLLAGVLADGQGSGAFGFSDRDLALRALLGMVNHTVQWFRARGRLTGDQIADGYVDLVVGGKR